MLKLITLFLTTLAFAKSNPWAELKAPLPPAHTTPEIFGTYALGCIAGAKPLALTTKSWEIVNPRRRRNYAHPDLEMFLNDLGTWSTAQKYGKIVVGDLSQPAGGPLPTGHASHQVGLDADIRFGFFPSDKVMTSSERENFPEVHVAEHEVLHDAKGDHLSSQLFAREWTKSLAELLNQAALDLKVERIFVSPPVKKALCQTYGEPYPAWLKKISPYFGHDEHFHVRLACPVSSPGCLHQAPIATDPTDGTHVGCGGQALAWWFSTSTTKGTYMGDAITEFKNPSKKENPEEKLGHLPEECSRLLKNRGAN